MVMKMLTRHLDAREPDSPLFVEGGKTMTTSQFVRKVGFASAELWTSDLTGGRVVAWLGHNSIRMLAYLFACHRAGAVFMPLNWRLALPELRAQLRHAGACALMHDDAHAELAAQLQGDLAPRDEPADGVEPGDVLLVYTSGTTGEPKGAMHTKQGLAANIEAAIAAQHLKKKTKTLAVLPMFHMGGLAIQVLPTLAAGGQVMIHPRFEAEAWFDAVARWRPHTTLLVPAVMRALVEHPLWAEADLSSLRFVTAGSQIVPPALIDAFHARDIPVAQVYGATETGPVSLVVEPGEAMDFPDRSGRAAPGVEVRLAEDGEILLRAPNLMRGYHRHAEPSFDAEGWFATGDLAVDHGEGWYEVVGRSKELIISGGENIHPAEIENLVAQFPGVAECAVVGLRDERWGEVPILAVVPRAGETFDEQALLDVLRLALARFKIPRRVVLLPELPRTALGKVQRGALAKSLAGGGIPDL
jgi:fatty-acyl-CoA synthase